MTTATAATAMAPRHAAHPGPLAARRAERLELVGVRRHFEVRTRTSFARHEALPATTLHLRRGEWVGVLGPGTEPLALLHCVAGLLEASAGSRRWLDPDGHDAPAPPVAFVQADWSSYACFTVGDVVHLAATRGARSHAATLTSTASARAERRRVRVLGWASLEGIERRHVRALHPYARWRVGVAAAVAGGARWLALELPPPLPHGERLATLGAMVRALRAAGVTALMAGSLATRLPSTRLHVMHPACGAAVRTRVAEGGRAAWPPAAAGVASPSGAV